MKRLEWLVRGWFFALGCWFTVGVVYLFAYAPEYAAAVIEHAANTFVVLR